MRSKDAARVRLGPPGGSHGYDPAAPSMHAVFLARGPSFRRGAVVEAFENVHLYEIPINVWKRRCV